MSEGLITRIGQWLDRQWEASATEGELEEVKTLMNTRIANAEMALSRIDIGDLKSRLEKIELYCGMTRKVDPTKPAVAKSAFSM